jgi:predicted ribosome quality control (RQC) complex YloA/Tae2 family protein
MATKQRFSALDIAAIIAELGPKLEGLRLSNIYDVNPKTFLLKFQKPDLKELILVESGSRFHSTQYVRDKQQTPSGFNAKLRKHLKSKRLISLKQIGNDRRIDFQFGEGEFSYHLIVEFFAIGNIILTDHEKKILAVLRMVEFTDGKTSITTGQIYEIPKSQELQSVNIDFIATSFETLMAKRKEAAEPTEIEPVEIPTSSKFRGFKKKKKNERKKDVALKGALRTIFGPTFGTSITDHALALSQLDPTISDFQCFTDPNSPEFKALFDALGKCDQLVSSCIGSTQKGYIICTKLIDESVQVDEPSVGTPALEFVEFLPFMPAYITSEKIILHFDSFDKAVDEFFSKLEAQQLKQKSRQAEAAAMKKLEAVKRNNANQIRNFQVSQKEKQLIANAIEMDLDNVQNVIQTVKSLVNSGMNWNDIQELIDNEKEDGNPLAGMICDLKLEKRIISIKLPLPDQFEENDDEDNTSEEQEQLDDQAETIIVDINIDQSAYSNARSYYDAKKIASQKEKKTIEASARALQITEEKILKTLQKKESEVASISRLRHPFWFEKFLWFVSTENFLVIGGRDATQNEQLITKYMKPNDLLVHSEMKGAACVLVKPLDSENQVAGMTTLLQAGTMSVCQSHSWEAKIITSAYYISIDQILKSNHAGMFPQGEFEVKGKKNYLPPVQLVYGISLMFQIEEDCIENHRLERRPWLRDGFIPDSQVVDVSNLIINDNNNDVEIASSQTFDKEDIEANAHKKNYPSNRDDQSSSVEHDGEDQNEIEDVKLETSTNKMRLSAKQRRDLKKGKDISAAPIESTAVNDEKNCAEIVEVIQSKKMPRGKKSKLKKIQSKYGDQDEEDRIIMMEKLGSAKGPQPKGKKEKAAAEKLAEFNAKIARAPPKQSHPPKNDSVMIKADIDIPETNLDNLTGQPLPSDKIIACVPVCAPWIALQKYQYKIKILPGSLKRGKASSQAQNAFQNMLKSGSNEFIVQHVENVQQTEWLNAVLSKSKLVISK